MASTTFYDTSEVTGGSIYCDNGTTGGATVDISYHNNEIYLTASTTETISVTYTYYVNGSSWGVQDYCYNKLYVNPSRRETKEETALRKKREKEEHDRRVAVEKRAMLLFRNVVGRRRASRFQKNGYIDVIARSGRRYRLRKGRMVELMKGNFGSVVECRLCAVSSDGRVPQMDVLIAQYLYLSCEEESFKEVAIRHAA